jgi:hypothetical protein
MTIRSRHVLLLAAMGAVAVIAAFLATSGRHSAADARPSTRASMPALKPLHQVREGNEIRADYNYDRVARKAPRQQTVPRARAADVLAGFSVLARPQTAVEHADFDIQQFAKDVPTAQVDRARALNAARTVWIIPTTDGQLCVGMKTANDATTFVNACGPAANALTTGISMTHADGKLALVPDDAHAAQATIKGARSAVDEDVSKNYVWLPDGGTVTFTDASGAHTL